jgi:hypothetical protein
MRSRPGTTGTLFRFSRLGQEDDVAAMGFDRRRATDPPRRAQAAPNRRLQWRRELESSEAKIALA